MDWSNEFGINTTIIPVPINFREETNYFNQPRGDNFNYQPSNTTHNEDRVDRNGNWILIDDQETENIRENFRPSIITPYTPISLYNKRYWTKLEDGTDMDPTVLKNDLQTFFIGTRDGKVRRLKSTNLTKKGEDYVFSEPIIDIEVDAYFLQTVVLTKSKIWQVYETDGKTSQVGPVDEYLKLFDTYLGVFVFTKTGNIYELNRSFHVITVKSTKKIASHIESITAVQNSGTEAVVYFAITDWNRIAILSLTRKDANDFQIHFVFQFEVNTQGTLQIATTNNKLFVNPTNCWYDQTSAMTKLRSFTWANLVQKQAVFEEILLPGFRVYSMSCDLIDLVVTMGQNTIVIYDANHNKRLYVLTIEEQPIMAKILYNYIIYVAEDVIRVKMLPKTNKVCYRCMSEFENPFINSNNSFTTVFVCKHYIAK